MIVPDEYRMRVYAAEDSLAETDDTVGTLELPAPRTFDDLDGVQTFIRQICEFPLVVNAWTPPGPPPKVAPRSRDKYAHYNRRYNVIAVPAQKSYPSRWPMSEFDVLHELAHFFNREKLDEPQHGSNFVSCYLDLLRHVLHPNWELRMIRALEEQGVPLS